MIKGVLCAKIICLLKKYNILKDKLFKMCRNCVQMPPFLCLSTGQDGLIIGLRMFITLCRTRILGKLIKLLNHYKTMVTSSIRIKNIIKRVIEQMFNCHKKKRENMRYIMFKNHLKSKYVFWSINHLLDAD